ncbi:MAG: sarcosine oxidase subunit gamma family protein [Pseudomonadota bacterium]
MSKPVAALGGAKAKGTVIAIEEAAPQGQMTLKGDIGGSAIAALMVEITGTTVPGKLGVTAKGDTRTVWMAPDELLVIMARDKVGGAVERAGEVLAQSHHMALDVSDTRAVFRLKGALVGEVLAKGVPCDTSDRGFPVGTARRTHLGGQSVGIWRTGVEDWELVCFRSFAHHIFAWLEHAAREGAEVGL